MTAWARTGQGQFVIEIETSGRGVTFRWPTASLKKKREANSHATLTARPLSELQRCRYTEANIQMLFLPHRIEFFLLLVSIYRTLLCACTIEGFPLFSATSHTHTHTNCGAQLTVMTHRETLEISFFLLSHVHRCTVYMYTIYSYTHFLSFANKNLSEFISFQILKACIIWCAFEEAHNLLSLYFNKLNFKTLSLCLFLGSDRTFIVRLHIQI